MIVELVSRLSQLAAIRNLAVLVTTNVMTRVIADTGALLQPAIRGQEWDGAFSSRVSLHFDWAPKMSYGSETLSGIVRYADVTNTRGDYRGLACLMIDQVSIFSRSSNSRLIINQTGVHDVCVDRTVQADQLIYASSSYRKRAYDEANDSTHDHSADEYGWTEDNEEMLAEEQLVVGESL